MPPPPRGSRGRASACPQAARRGRALPRRGPDRGRAPREGVCSIKIERKNEISNFLLKIGVCFQGNALFDSYKVWENIAFEKVHSKQSVNRRVAKDMAVEKLVEVGLDPSTAELYPYELSGGMQKRVGIARAIFSNPDILFFDEPTTGLDPIMTDVINHLIRDCVNELGATTMTITHDMSSVRTIGDKAALLYQGKIIWTGNVDSLDQSDDPFLVQFVNGLADGPIEISGA